MHCSNCGKDIKPDSQFCKYCGTPLTQTCPKCGKANNLDSRFCKFCGQALGQAAPAPVPVPPPVVPQVIYVQPPVEAPRRGMPGWGWALVAVAAFAVIAVPAFFLLMNLSGGLNLLPVTATSRVLQNPQNQQDPQDQVNLAVQQTMQAATRQALSVQQTLTALAPAQPPASSYAADLATAQSWPILVNDPFDDARFGWPVDSHSGTTPTYTKSIADGRYQITYQTGPGQGAIVWNIPSQIPDLSFSRFYVAMDARLQSSSPSACIGFMIRNTGNNDFIDPCIKNNQQYSIDAKASGQWSNLARGTSNAIVAGGVNRIALIGLDGKYYLFINGTFIIRVETAILSQGRISPLFGVVENDTTSVTYDNFELRLPGATALNPVQPAACAPTVKVTEATNCREGPAAAYDHVSDFYTSDVATIVGKNAEGTYWVVNSPHASGTCWLWGQTAIVTGDTACLPVVEPPAPPPAKFVVSYAGLESCGGPAQYAFRFNIKNTGGMTLESIKMVVADNTAGSSTTHTLNSFRSYNGCIQDPDVQGLLPGETTAVVNFSPGISYNPSGHSMTAAITICTGNGLAGTCTSATINFTP